MTEDRYKFPRIPHLPWSNPGNEDKKLQSVSRLKQLREVVVTEKLDGENFTLYRDGCHARSTDSSSHSSQSYVRQMAATVAHLIPEGWRVCGENLLATHSLFYSRLPSYFLVFAVFDHQLCLPWDETRDFAKSLGLETVPEIYRGAFRDKAIRNCYSGKSQCGGKQEGYVVRPSGAVHFSSFSKDTAKYVRKNHVTSDRHWRVGTYRENRLVS